MNDFVLSLEEKLKEKGVSLRISLQPDLISGEWLKKDMEMRRWNGHAEIPQNLFDPYPYLTRIMMDYNCDMDIERQAFTNIYWVSIKSFSHPVLVTQQYSLEEGLKKLEKQVQAEYIHTLGYFEETVFQLSEKNKSLLILEENYSYRTFVINEENKTKVLEGNNVPTLLSGELAIQKLLRYKQKLLLHYLREEEVYESKISTDETDLVSIKKTLNDSLQNLNVLILKNHRKD